MRPRTQLLLASLLVGALVAAPAASAMYIVTPLKIRASDDAPEAGDTITLTLLPDPEHDDPNATSLAGKTVLVKANYDPKEGEEGSEPGSAQPVFLDLGSVTLDAEQSGTLTWTIPAELDRHNVFLTAVDEEGNDVGIGYGPLPVGEAPPMMTIMQGSPSEGSPEGTPLANEEAQGNLDDTDGGAPEPATNASSDQENATPGVGLLALVAVAGLAAVALRRRR